jgi:hypothetical protein
MSDCCVVAIRFAQEHFVLTQSCLTLEMIDERAGSKATAITSQLPTGHWH